MSSAPDADLHRRLEYHWCAQVPHRERLRWREPRLAPTFVVHREDPRRFGNLEIRVHTTQSLWVREAVIDITVFGR